MPPIDIAAARKTDVADMIESITGSATVVPNDNADLAFVTRALWVSVSGTLRVTMLDGMTQDYPVITAGRHPLRVTRVHSAGTSATGIVAEY